MEKLNQTATERRRITRNRLYRYLYDAPQGHSKQEMADDLGLSMPTVHQNLAELLQAELVRANGVRGSTGGRRATQIAVAENARFALGISVSGDHFRILAANLRLGGDSPTGVQTTPAPKAWPSLAGCLPPRSSIF